jgi:hypothetical protein
MWSAPSPPGLKEGLAMPVPLFTAATLPLASGEARCWEDEIVYVVIIEKFFNGDPANDIMRNAFFQDRH